MRSITYNDIEMSLFKGGRRTEKISAPETLKRSQPTLTHITPINKVFV